jgi:hypothetical protein
MFAWYGGMMNCHCCRCRAELAVLLAEAELSLAREIGLPASVRLCVRVLAYSRAVLCRCPPCRRSPTLF